MITHTSAAMTTYPFHSPAIRDLAWACFSPPVMHSDAFSDGPANVANCALSLTPARLEWLLALDRDPASLLAHIDGVQSHRLGIYFESLWHFFLTHDDQVDLVAHNLPIRHEGKTLGEFDCLYFCRQRQRHVHLELAVKYFLSNHTETRDEHASQWREWWGPECQDRLDLKVNHLMQHQIQLSQYPQAKTALNQLGIVELAKEVEIKGYLFQARHDPIPPPYGYNQEKNLNQWVFMKDLAAFAKAREFDTFKYLEKREWLAPWRGRVAELDLPALTESLARRPLRNAVHADQIRPSLVAAIDDSGEEIDRFFVVDNHWPTGNGERA
jgi:hypothetical protein